jgi:hypothetical protein
MNQEPVFAINPRILGGDLGKYHRGYAEPATAERVGECLSNPLLGQTVLDVRRGQEERKDLLFSICPHYKYFNNDHRAQADIIPEAFTFKTCVDVDELSLVDQAISKAREVNSDPMSDWQDMVLYIEYSARHKVHIWILMPVGMTIEEAQKAFCEEIGIPYDESCITPERYIYMTGDEVYKSDKWLQPLSEEEVEERREAFLNRGLDVDGRPLKKPESAKAVATEAAPSADSLGIIPAETRTRYILKACMDEEGVTVDDLNVEGDRHNSVKMVLSTAVQLLKQGEFLGALSELMPNNWQDDNIQKLVSDFYAKYYDPSQKLTLAQKRIFRESRKKREEVKGEESATSSESAQDSLETSDGNQSPLSKLFAAPKPPEMPKMLPRLVKVVTSQTPDIYKPTVAQAMFPPLATYPRQLRFKYIDNQDRELRINCLIVAETGSGKDSCTRQPLNHILAPMKERDAVNRERLKKFNEEYNSKASNKEKPKRPDDLIIQTVKSDITRAALIQRMDEAQGAPLYVKMSEIEQWDKVEGASGRSNQFTNLKMNDDEDNDFGADRAGTQSVTASVSLHLNWNANTVITKAQNYFRFVPNDGPLSRLVLATVHEAEIGADIPVFGNYDEKYDQALQPYLDNLSAATGSIDCPQAKRLARKLKAECSEFARLSQDRVFDNLSHRALVHAFRKACLLYAANGMKWEKSIESFCRWSLFYDLYLKIKLWGDIIRHADDNVPTSKRGPRNLLEDIKTDENGVFTYRDAVNARLKNSMNEEGTKNMLYQWKSRGYILQLTDDSFKKAR